MNEKEHLLQVIDNEMPAFIKVLEALPADKLDWKPDPKSKSAIELASYMAKEPGQVVDVIETGKLDFDQVSKTNFGSGAEAAEKFRTDMGKMKTLLSGMSEDDWSAEAAMIMGGQEVWKTKKGGMAWGYMLDLIHHRGQLSTYLRPMGGQVPAIYGPSADANE